ncbi:uncharacterized protein LOC119599573 [Lucilia sericata]|uniref:uncharacterized protein LOC119599573 n=1 Tax=Lucilia sericata TaxID=13632 RepID=UPI0018A7E9B2|nr:uncharacterized protein LOC119599573 [Lucilia sericata]
MFKLKQFFVTTLIVSLVIVPCKTDNIEVIDVENNVTDSPAETAVLKLLNVTESDAGAVIYTYKCTVGTYQSGRLACIANNNTSWNSPHDAELKLRCPKVGSGVVLSYVEILYSVTYPNVKCYVNEGAVGLRYIGVTVNAWNTLMFNYWAYFYTF